MGWKILSFWYDEKTGKYDKEDICDYNFENLCMAVKLERAEDIFGYTILKDEKDQFDLNKFEETEKSLLIMVLSKHNYVQNKAAKELGISPRTMNYKVQKYKLKHVNWKVNKE